MDASTVNVLIGVCGALGGSVVSYFLLGRTQSAKLVQEMYSGSLKDLQLRYDSLATELSTMRKVLDEKDVAYFKNQNLWMEENRSLRNKIDTLEREKTELQRKVETLENK